jgi:Nitroreductase family
MPWEHLDTAMAAPLVLLTAVDEGLGAVFFGIVVRETRALRTEFGIPDDQEPIGGYRHRPRRPNRADQPGFPPASARRDDPLRPVVIHAARSRSVRQPCIRATWPS